MNRTCTAPQCTNVVNTRTSGVCRKHMHSEWCSCHVCTGKRAKSARYESQRDRPITMPQGFGGLKAVESISVLGRHNGIMDDDLYNLFFNDDGVGV